MENVIETIKDIIQKEKEKVNIHLKSSTEAKQYCYGYLDAICIYDDDYDYLSNLIDTTF